MSLPSADAAPPAHTSPPTPHPDPGGAGEDVLRIESLVKRYRGKRTPANDGITLSAARGRVLGVLGHNGAGKTTLVNQIVGLLRPSSGSISVAGVDAIAHPDRARELVSVQAQANVPITGLTPRTAIELIGRIRGGGKTETRRRAAELLEMLDLGPWADTPAQKISGGVARLTAYCMAAIRPGALVILDEPTNDVDPARRRLLWDAIRATAAEGAGVLLVTHNVREAERVVDDLIVLDRGRVIASGSPAQLTSHLRSQLLLELDGTAIPAPPTGLRLESVGLAQSVVAVPADRGAEAVDWAQACVSRGDIERFSLTPASLEDAYLELVGSDTEDAA